VRKHDCANVNFENVRKRVSPVVMTLNVISNVIDYIYKVIVIKSITFEY